MKIVSILSPKKRNIAAGVLVAAFMAVGVSDAAALTPSYYASGSKLSTGKWVKIKTSGEGMHEITYDQLRQWGFADPSKVNVYGYGATLLAADKFKETDPDDVRMTYSNHEGDKLYFYSTGDVTANLMSATLVETLRNHYSTEVYYLLSDREPAQGEKSDNASVAANSTVYDAHMSVIYDEEEIYNPTHAGGYFLGKDFTAAGKIDLPFTFTNISKGNSPWDEITLGFRFGALNSYATKLNVKAPSNMPSPTTSQVAANYSFDGFEKYKLGSTTLSFKNMSEANIVDGTYIFTATPNYTPSYIAMDYSWAIYPRLNKLGDDAQLSMYFPSVSSEINFSIEGGESLRVVNVTAADNIFGHNLNYEDGTAVGTFDRSYKTSAPSCHLVAYDTAKKQMEVEFAGEIANQNLHGIETPDMVILTTAELMASAEQLAEAHRSHDGMTVAVIQHDKIFNEFSSATPDAMGYRRFFKMLYDRDPQKFKYVIMYGPSNWDNRGIINEKKDRLLVYETLDPEYSFKETFAFASDCYFGMLKDDYDPAKIIKTQQQIPVGRMPVTNEAQAVSMNRKILRHMESLPSTTLYNTTLVMSDDGDSNQHLNQAEALAEALQKAHDASTIVRAHNSIYRWDVRDAKDLRTVAINALNRGVGMFVYVGHGSSDGFGAEQLWSHTITANTSYELPPIGMFATCTALGFDLGRNGIGEGMLFKEDGGMIAIISSCRTVYGNLNQDLALNVIREYAAAQDNATIGQIWLNARNKAIAAYKEDSQINTMCYNLGGDPALRILPPTYKVQLTKAPAEGQLQPLETVEIEGNILTPEGNLADDFNGILTLQLYDAPYDVDVLIRNSGDAPKTIQLDQDILMTKTAEIKNGKFKTTFAAPVPVHENSDKINRLTFHADATDGRRGDGIFRGLKVEATNDGNGDVEGSAPVIDYLAVNDAFNGDGSFVSNEVNIIASGSVSAVGINTSSAIGAGSSLIIDGTRHITGAKEALRIGTDNTWKLSLPINNLEEGTHSATLTIADNSGRRTTQTISFILGSENAVELTADATTVRNEVTFDVFHMLGEINASRLIIEDRMGNTVYNNENPTFPLTLNLAALENGGTMADGHYKAFVQMKGSTGKGSSPRVPFVLIKKK